MLKCFDSNGLAKQFDGSKSSPVETPSAENTDIAGKAMGKELLAAATEYVRIYLLGSLLDGSGSGAVAIDNKIEQAMDLVKSHLMFAVREEVDLLKEKIKELLERNDQLIRENSFLREHATPDTLALLSSTSVSPQ